MHFWVGCRIPPEALPYSSQGLAVFLPRHCRIPPGPSSLRIWMANTLLPYTHPSPLQKKTDIFCQFFDQIWTKNQRFFNSTNPLPYTIAVFLPNPLPYYSESPPYTGIYWCLTDLIWLIDWSPIKVIVVVVIYILIDLTWLTWFDCFNLIDWFDWFDLTGWFDWWIWLVDLIRFGILRISIITSFRRLMMIAMITQ